jgi:hypothetical protein
MSLRRWPLTFVWIAAFATPATSQSIPLRSLGPIDVRSTIPLYDASQVVTLGNGRVLVLDHGRRQALLLNAALADPVVVIDSTSGDTTSYNGSNTRLIPFRGDSVVIYQPASAEFLVFDGRGGLGRTFPNTRDVSRVPIAVAARRGPGGAAGPPSAAPSTYSPAFGFLANGGSAPGTGLVGTSVALSTGRMTAPVGARLIQSDSTMVFARSFDGRPDVIVARIGIGRLVVGTVEPAQPGAGRIGGGGGASSLPTRIDTTRVATPSPGPVLRIRTSYPGVIPFYDEYDVTSDGAIALFRAGEYRFDWVNPDGSRTSSPPLPYDPPLVTAADRRRIADSLGAADRAWYEKALERFKNDSATYAATGVAALMNTLRRPVAVPPRDPAQIPDQFAPTSGNGVIADRENRLWVRPRRASGSPLGADNVYDVVDRSGRLAERVRVPVGWDIVAFIPGFAIIRSVTGTSATLARARIL